MEEGRGPRVPRVPRVPRFRGPKDQDFSNSHSNTNLTLTKVHLVITIMIQDKYLLEQSGGSRNTFINDFKIIKTVSKNGESCHIKAVSCYKWSVSHNSSQPFHLKGSEKGTDKWSPLKVVEFHSNAVLLDGGIHLLLLKNTIICLADCKMKPLELLQLKFLGTSLLMLWLSSNV